MRLTKLNPETGEYVYIEPAKTQAELWAQRKAVIQKLGAYEDGADEARAEALKELQEKIHKDPKFMFLRDGWAFLQMLDKYVKEMLERQPTADVVEVVRCGECRHCKYNSSADKYKCDRRGYYSETVEATDYCSWGERREENER